MILWELYLDPVHQMGEIDYMDGNGFQKVMDIFEGIPEILDG
jgi:hypothetical protein